MKKISLLFATTLLLTVMTPVVNAESTNSKEIDKSEDVVILDKKYSVNSPSIKVRTSRMYTSNNNIPSSLYVSRSYGGYLYRGTIYLDEVKRLSNGNYMAYYSGNIPKTPIMTSNIKAK